MSLGAIRNWPILALAGLILATGTALMPSQGYAQSELTRRVKTKAAPVYPELARRSNLRGTVKVLVVVAPDGSIKQSKVVGGNPVLVDAAMDALKKWKFEAANEESSGTVEFKFQP